MRPGEVLEAQHDLQERIKEERFAAVLDTFGEMEMGREGGFRRKQSTPQSEILKNMLPVAHTYRVTHDMSMLVEHAANGLEDTDQFDRSLAPTQVGFVAFDRPLPVHDVRGKTMLIHFLIWGPTATYFEGTGETGSCTLMMTFNDRWRQPDEVEAIQKESWMIGEGAKRYQKLMHVLGRWGQVGQSPIFDGQRMGPSMVLPSERYAAQLAKEGVAAVPSTNTARYLHALWLLMDQTVAKVEDDRLNFHERKALKKMRKPGKVTVIKLRREADANRKQGESDVEWAHRWVVRGHWRWQACGVGRAERKRIWIAPFIKGPDGAPFVQSEKVYSLER